MSVLSIQRRFAAIARQIGRSTPAQATLEDDIWWSTARLAAYLDLTDHQRPREAAREWADRKELAFILIGRERRYARRDIQRAIERELHARRHAGRVVRQTA